MEIELRKNWNHDAANVERHVDYIVDKLKVQGEAAPAAYMAVDMVYRPFLQWLHSSHIQNIDPSLVRNSMVHLVNMMILEAAARMNNLQLGLDPALEWVNEFLDVVQDEVNTDLQTLTRQGISR